jgi:hypothetical protein
MRYVEFGALKLRTKLEVARDLVRIYREVLHMPVPDDLAALVKRLEAEE